MDATLPYERVGPRFIAARLVAQFVFFVVLSGPAIVGLGLKIQTIVPDSEKTPAGRLCRFA